MSQLKSNNDRQLQIEQKAAQVNTMFAQMLEKCSALPKGETGPFVAKKHRFGGGDARSAQSEFHFTSSKSEVGARIPDSERLTLRSQEDDFDDANLPLVGHDGQILDYEYQTTQEDFSSPFVKVPMSANLRQASDFQARRKVVGPGGTGGGFASSLVSSEAQEFLMLE